MRSDLFHLDTPNGREHYEFTAPGWHTWSKPKGARLVHFQMTAGGAGGGGGHTRASGNQGGGGSGGSYGSTLWAWIPAVMLPPTVWLYVGMGGEGGAAGADGEPGENSGITVYPKLSNAQLLSSGFALGADGGVQGRFGTAVAGGSGPGNPNSTVGSGWFQGVVRVYAGGNGFAGGASGAGVGFQLGSNTTSYFMAGLGGAGVTSGDVAAAGGGITIATLTPYSQMTPIPGGAAGGGHGSPGIFVPGPVPIFIGGMGGGSNGTGPGGNGGNGALGCGGGGGGAGTTGGSGGRGGHGRIIVAVL